MKKITVFVTAIVITALTTILSCNKQTEIPSYGFIAKVRMVTEKHKLNNSNIVTYNRTDPDEGQLGNTIFGTVVNDILGSLGGGQAGFQAGLYFPPHGPAIGASIGILLGGWSASGALLANHSGHDDFIMSTEDPLIDNSEYIEVLTDGIEIGIAHNTLITEINNNFSNYFNNDGTPKLDEFWDLTDAYLAEFASDSFDYTDYLIDRDTSIQEFCNISAFCGGLTYLEMLDQYEENEVISAMEKDFFLIFIESFEDLPSVEDFHDYCQDLIDTINQDSEMSSTQKQKLKHVVNLGYHSYSYWFTNLN